ncbi:MAG: TonB-dependent receptor [Novosphingobium pentaromativorans]|uniref:TonB-dependent receptor n=1 Tax=Novosphingobium pentaromativorans TaxID=205844 RepID=A0A2W5NX01_9SPHN|nr:TonB-dependent receptor [Novosphingobium panipatense]PZQ56459.1 MAG: TonB-dependent receptor [Novosphingobium pentaromativorans]
MRTIVQASRRARLLAGISAATAALAMIAPASAQETAPDQGSGAGTAQVGEAEAQDIIVTGVRASLSSAQSIKRNSDVIVDSIVAEDIGKLPDRNVAEALQRITGIQIQRSFGEGSSVSIRGLSQVRTEVNGRDVFTANGGRTLSLEDVPSELLAGVDVYKNPSADQIEGGIGGLINLRTRKPFDFDGFKASASASINYYDLYGKSTPQANLLLSDRWDTGIGEIGVMVDFAYQKTAFRQDQISSQPFYELDQSLDANGNPNDATDYAVAAGLGRLGKDTYMPHGVGIGQYLGDRRRLGIDAAVQWKPTDTLLFTGEYVRSDYKFQYGDYSFFAYTGDNPITPDYTQPFSFDDDGNFRSGTFVNVPIDSNTSLERRKSVTNDFSLNMKWTPTNNLTVNGDFQYIRGTTDGQRSIVILHSNAERLYQVVGSGVPTMDILPDNDPTNGNGSVTDVANYAPLGGGYLDHIERSVGKEYAGRLDAEYRFDGGFLRSISAGLRYTDRSAVTDSSTYAYYGTTALADNLYEVHPFRGDLYRGYQGVPDGGVFFSRGIVLDYDATRQALAPYVSDSQRQALLDGVSYVPSDRNTQGEKTYTAYGLAKFDFADSGFPLDGNIGVRVIKTKVSTDGFIVQTPQAIIDGQPGNGPISYVPLGVNSSYTKALPSLNLRYHFNDKLQLRLAASKGLTRPDFSQLNPNINIVEFNSGSGLRTASSGNPFLKPLEANQFDASLEWYFSQTGSLYGAAFYKKVDGFIANITSTETYDFGNGPFNVDVTRPLNGDNGKIKGFEIGGNTFFDFLPGWLSGFGVQANFTYVDSKAPSPDAADNEGNKLSVPLELLSKYSYNLIGFYDRGPLSARVAYNWRSKYVVTTRGNGSGNLPIFNDARGQLDASITYTVTPNFALTLDGVNLTNTENRTYYGIASRPQSNVLNDRRISLTARLTY